MANWQISNYPPPAAVSKAIHAAIYGPPKPKQSVDSLNPAQKQELETVLTGIAGQHLKAALKDPIGGVTKATKQPITVPTQENTGPQTKQDYQTGLWHTTSLTGTPRVYLLAQMKPAGDGLTHVQVSHNKSLNMAVGSVNSDFPRPYGCAFNFVEATGVLNDALGYCIHNGVVVAASLNSPEKSGTEYAIVQVSVQTLNTSMAYVHLQLYCPKYADRNVTYGCKFKLTSDYMGLAYILFHTLYNALTKNILDEAPQ